MRIRKEKYLSRVIRTFNNRERREELLLRLTDLPFLLSSLAMLLVLYEFGFDHSERIAEFLRLFYTTTLIAGIISIPARYIKAGKLPALKIIITECAILAILILYVLIRLDVVSIILPAGSFLIYPMLFLVFIRELSVRQGTKRVRNINPAQLFIASFLLMILTGSLILILPNATRDGISYIDSLFTAASAVCVTGLIVVDTGSHFTLFGQVIILILIQLGGLGIMTFTSYFSYFFQGGSSYQNQLMLKDLTNAGKMAGVFSTLKKVIIVTFIIEAFGAVLIFIRIDPTLIPLTYERLFFALFHSVSAFCNAGFSTLPDSLWTEGFKYAYRMHMIFAVLFITGGLGFPILFNFLRYLRHLLVNLIFRRKKKHVPWVINVNTRIVFFTTLILLAGGTLLFLMLEYQNTLADHNTTGKLAAAFFSAATPRTAGFNVIDTSSLTMPAILLTIMLMWIGASPGSTGGGIKTSTIATAFLTIVSVARGRDKTELAYRNISERSVRRAFSIIVLSLMAIAVSVFLISLTEKDIALHKIVFESVSAFCTTGLSLGITAALGSTAKMVLIITMFTGRVGMITILSAVMKKIENKAYRYIDEDILIN
ncbi:MAG: potassium transporter TrkG [Bacteroidales bacterium]